MNLDLDWDAMTQMAAFVIDPSRTTASGGQIHPLAPGLSVRIVNLSPALHPRH
jgi:hypothetical protein